MLERGLRLGLFWKSKTYVILAFCQREDGLKLEWIGAGCQICQKTTSFGFFFVMKIASLKGEIRVRIHFGPKCDWPRKLQVKFGWIWHCGLVVWLNLIGEKQIDKGIFSIFKRINKNVYAWILMLSEYKTRVHIGWLFTPWWCRTWAWTLLWAGTGGNLEIWHEDNCA